LLAGLTMVLLCSWDAKGQPMDDARLRDFAARYTAAWSSQDAARVASMYDESGSLKINDGEPLVGRAAITAAAQSYMTALPDMVLTMDAVSIDGDGAIYRWTLTGTNTGPGGTGRGVQISGYEQWTFAPNGLIAQSLGHFDTGDYQRQLMGEATAESEAKAELLALEKAWIDAEVQHDRAALEQILDEGFVATFASGRTVDRETFIEGVLSRALDPFEVFRDFVRVYGDAALVIDSSTDHKTKFTWIAVRREGQWRVISETFTRVSASH